MYELKIYYHHTDAGGVVYYANYLKFLEEARTEFFAEKGLSVRDLAKEGVLFVVSHQEIDYKFPGFYGDTLRVNTKLVSNSGVKFYFEYEIKNQDGRLLCLAKTTMVCVDSTLRPKAMPEEILKRLTS